MKPVTETAEFIDYRMGDRTRARISRSSLAAMMAIDGNLRAVHLNLIQTALSLRGIGLHELESGAIGLIRIRILDGAKQL